MKLYFVRHGESEANVLRVFSNTGLKHPLTSLGREQAKQLADSLANDGVTEIWASPLLRAVQTADVLSAALGLPFTTTDALREYDCGTLEGRSDDEGWAAYAEAQQAWLVDKKLDTRTAGGESFHDMEERFLPFIKELTTARGATSDGAVLIGHGGLYRCMLPLVLTNIDYPFVLANPFTQAGRVTANYTQSQLICLDWCGTPPPPPMATKA